MTKPPLYYPASQVLTGIKDYLTRQSRAAGLATALIMFHAQAPQAFAQTPTATATATSTEATFENGTINGELAITAIGPLHLSEGKVIIQENLITVLSDSAGPMSEAELTGVIFNPHETRTPSERSVYGTAMFYRGYSLPALAVQSSTDLVKCTDGQDRVGQIVEVTAKMLRIKTATGTQAIPARFVTDIKSPRAFNFSFPVNSISTGPNVPQSPGNRVAGAPSAIPAVSPQWPSGSRTGDKSIISFDPTFAQDLSIAPSTANVKNLHAQLTERHPGKHAVKVAAVTAGVVACFAIPAAVAVICPRPKTASMSSTSSSSGM